MANMEEFVQKQVAKYFEKTAPHLKQPAAIYGRITSSASAGADTWTYSVKLLDENQSPDKYPEIPNIKSKIEIEQGKLAAVVLLYGKTPFVVGEVPE